MELAYLWVEKYKNIEKQGFNFSPRFNCNFIDNNLTIDEREEYVSIFPENINITAIVGENGSGKSSIAELLGEFNFQEFHEPNKSFIVFFHNGSFIFRCNLTGTNLYFNINNKTKHESSTTSHSRELFISYFASELSTFLSKELSQSRNYDKFDAVRDDSKQQVMDNNKLSISREKILEYELFNKRFEKILSGNKDLFQQINRNLIFNNRKREIHFYEIGAEIIGEDNPINKLFKESPYKGRTLFDDIPLEETPHQTYFYKYLILNRLEFIHPSMLKNISFEQLIKNIKETFQKEILEEEDYSEIINKIHNANPIDDDSYKIENVREILENFEYKSKNIWIEKKATNISKEYSFKNPLIKKINQYKTIRTNYFNNKNEEYNYLSLSSGEREYIKLFTHIIYHLQQEDRRDIFFLDEPDLALHPNWQKRLTNDLLHFTKRYTEEKSIHLILTSHSPFLLSDMPKEHVIFLKEGEQQHPFKENEQTFGANIHTLLSHGFFMDNGLMGEFAKSKIEKIKDFYEKIKNSENPKEKYQQEYKKYIENFRHIQSIIGEPFLKTIIGNYLEEIELLFSDDSIDIELKKLEQRRQYLKKLQNAKN